MRRLRAARTILFNEIVPVAGMTHSDYICDTKFFIDPILEKSSSCETLYGLVSIDGEACCIGIMESGNVHLKKKFHDELPKHHKKGGSSAPRFQRIRLEKRGAYVNKASETCDSYFIEAGSPVIEGLFIAGCASFKEELATALPKCLCDGIITTVVSSSTGKSAFYEAAAKCSQMIRDHEMIRGENDLKELLDQLQSDASEIKVKAVTGIKDVIRCLDYGIVDSVIVLKSPGVTHEDLPLDDWMAKFHNDITRVVTDRTELGCSFRGYGGVGAFLRFPIDTDMYFHDDIPE